MTYRLKLKKGIEIIESAEGFVERALAAAKFVIRPIRVQDEKTGKEVVRAISVPIEEAKEEVLFLGVSKLN